MAYKKNNGEFELQKGYGSKSLFRTGFGVTKAGGLYDNVTGVNAVSRLNRRRQNVNHDSDVNITTYDRTQIVSLCRQVSAQMSVLDVCKETLADWSVGQGDTFDLVYHSTSKTPKGWDAKVEKFINGDWKRNCSTRGFPFTRNDILHCISTDTFADGDIGINFVTENDYPQIQLIKGHRITSAKSKVPDGKLFAGYEIQDGVVTTPSGMAIALVVETGKDELIVPTIISGNEEASAMLAYKVKYSDYGRGIPQIASGLTDAANIQETQDNQLTKQKLMATLALLKIKHGGEADLGGSNFDDEECQTTGSSVHNMWGADRPRWFEAFNRGTVEYLDIGEDIKELKSNSPSNEFQSFFLDMKTELCAATGVPHQIIWSAATVQTGPARSVVNFFRNSVRREQAFLLKYYKEMVKWAISWAMEHGLLDPNDKEDWWNNFSFTLPGEFPFDRNESRLDLEQISAGMMSRNDMTIKDGKSFEQVLEQIDRENQMIFDKASAYSKKNNVDINTALLFYGAFCGTPNPPLLGLTESGSPPSGSAGAAPALIKK